MVLVRSPKQQQQQQQLPAWWAEEKPLITPNCSSLPPSGQPLPPLVLPQGRALGAPRDITVPVKFGQPDREGRLSAAGFNDPGQTTAGIFIYPCPSSAPRSSPVLPHSQLHPARPGPNWPIS